MSDCLRTCCVCRKKVSKSDLLRVVKTPEGKIFLDSTGKTDGRGAYICKNAECRSKLKKTKGLNRAFKGPVGEEVYEEVLKKEI